MTESSQDLSGPKPPECANARPTNKEVTAYASTNGNQCGSFLIAEFSPATSATTRHNLYPRYHDMQCSARFLYGALHIQGSIGPLSIGPDDAFQVRFVTGIFSSPTSAGNVHSSRFVVPVAFSHFSLGRVVVAVASNNTLFRQQVSVLHIHIKIGPERDEKKKKNTYAWLGSRSSQYHFTRNPMRRAFLSTRY